MSYTSFILNALHNKSQRVSLPSSKRVEAAKKRLAEIGDTKPKWNEVEKKMEIEQLKAIIESRTI